MAKRPGRESDHEFDDLAKCMEKHIMEGRSKISDDFLTEHLRGFGSTRECALLGKAPFDKLETVQDFLSERSFTKLNHERKTDDKIGWK
jgi:hypothetical protein